jgi:hypothetical protein
MFDRYDLVRKVVIDVLVFAAPGAAVVGTAVLVGSPGDTQITSGEWIAAAVAAILASSAIDAAAARRARAEARRLAGVRRDEKETDAAAQPPEPPEGGLRGGV